MVSIRYNVIVSRNKRFEDCLIATLHQLFDGAPAHINWRHDWIQLISIISCVPFNPLDSPLDDNFFFLSDFCSLLFLLSMCCSCCYCQFTIFNYILGKFLKQLILYWWLFEYKGKWIKKKISWYLKALSCFISRLFPLEKMAKKSDLEFTHLFLSSLCRMQ